MPSLSDVVTAMSKELENSTLGWDVVVNYTAKDLNEVLEAAYNKGHTGQLKEISVSLEERERPNIKYWVDYIFKLGAPLIQFEAMPLMTSACRLDIPVIGGSITVKYKGEDYTIPSGRYRLLLSGVALASVEGTMGAIRDPKSSDHPFIFHSSNKSGLVTLDLATSAKENRLQVEIIDLGPGQEIPYLEEDMLPRISTKVLAHLKQTDSIQWDIAQVNNTRPPSGSTVLVPERFRFACYAPTTGSYTILSIFIHFNGGYGGTGHALQEQWTTQWSGARYGVPPIPDSKELPGPYTASIIFNNSWMKDLVRKTAERAGMKIEEVPRKRDNSWAVKWKILTRKKYKVAKTEATGAQWPYSFYKVWPAEVDLDAESSEPFYLTIGQNGGSSAKANALLKWKFDFTTDWIWVNGSTGTPHGGDVTVKYTLDKEDFFDNHALSNYRVHLNASISKNDWGRTEEPSEGDWFNIIRQTHWDSPAFAALPDAPTFDLKLFDIDFFMTTNLLLPNQHVIEFNAEPGVRFPRDLYLVGHIIHESKVRARLVESAA